MKDQTSMNVNIIQRLHLMTEKLITAQMNEKMPGTLCFPLYL